MSEVDYVANLNNMDGIFTVIYDAAAVPEDVFHDVQLVHLESIKADLPKEQWPRVPGLVRLGDLETYMDRRVNPAHQAGKDGWHEEQIFEDPTLAVTFDRNGLVIGAEHVVLNTSGPKGWPKPAWLAVAKAKMIAPPWTPKLGGKKHIKITEAFTHPNAQTSIDAEEGIVVVGGINLAATYFSVRERDQRLGTASYVQLEDAADTTMINLTEALGMSPTVWDPKTVSGSNEDDPPTRVAAPARVVMGRSAGLLGVEVIRNFDVSRVTKD